LNQSAFPERFRSQFRSTYLWGIGAKLNEFAALYLSD
jgi:hypothetical protein